MARPTRAKFANKLTWLEKKEKDVSLVDARKNPRIVPAGMNSILTFADGATQDCIVIDMGRPPASRYWPTCSRRSDTGGGRLCRPRDPAHARGASR
jgi:hypothetical protein